MERNYATVSVTLSITPSSIQWMGPKALCFLVVRPSVRTYVRPSVRTRASVFTDQLSADF